MDSKRNLAFDYGVTEVEIREKGRLLGSLAFQESPYHATRVLLSFAYLYNLDGLILNAKEIFKALREHFGKPLELMVDSDSAGEKSLAMKGGFKAVAHTYDSSFVKADLLDRPNAKPIELKCALEGDETLRILARMAYEYYRRTEASVSPLTANLATFESALSKSAFFDVDAKGDIQNVAFFQGNAIQVFASAYPKGFKDFGYALALRFFGKYDSLKVTVDDFDPIGMDFLRLFKTKPGHSIDTWLLK